MNFLKILTVITIIATISVAQTWNGAANTDWYNAEQNEFTIATAEQLAGLATLVNGGNNLKNKTITLQNNIFLNDTTDWQNWENAAPANTWTAIGKDTNAAFRGTFDGAGHTVSGVYINNASADNQGFFGFVNTDGVVKNLSVIASFVKGRKNVGIVVGNNNSLVDNCHSNGKTAGKQSVGGIVGYNSGETTNSSSAGAVYGKGGKFYGGFVGGNDQGKISNSSSSASLGGRGMFFGSFVGGNDGKISNSYSTGEVNARGMFSGGFVGANTRNGTFIDSGKR